MMMSGPVYSLVAEEFEKTRVCEKQVPPGALPCGAARIGDELEFLPVVLPLLVAAAEEQGIFTARTTVFPLAVTPPVRDNTSIVSTGAYGKSLFNQLQLSSTFSNSGFASFTSLFFCGGRQPSRFLNLLNCIWSLTILNCVHS